MRIPMEYIETTIPPGVTIAEHKQQHPKDCDFCGRKVGETHKMFCIRPRFTSQVVR